MNKLKNLDLPGASEAAIRDSFVRLNQRQPPLADRMESSPQKCLSQATIDRNNVSGGASCLRAGEEQNGARAIDRIDRLMRQGALCVKFRKQVAEIIIAGCGVEANIVLVQRRDDALARKHCRSADDSCGANPVDAHQRRKRNGKLANQVADGGLADVIRFAAPLRDDRICGTGEHNAGIQTLLAKDTRRLTGEKIIGRHIDFERFPPLRLRSGVVRRRRKKCSCVDEEIETPAV